MTKLLPTSALWIPTPAPTTSKVWWLPFLGSTQLIGTRRQFNPVSTWACGTLGTRAIATRAPSWRSMTTVILSWSITSFAPASSLPWSRGDVYAAKPSCRAYVDKWTQELEGCKAAFAKWVDQCENLMSDPTSEVPDVFFALLPVVREKDRWVWQHGGPMYKVRLCMDMKNGGLNDLFSEWYFRYLGIDNVAFTVKKGDWLATIDISRFYLRLPAGARLRSVQWFQDPASYAGNKVNNENKKLRKLLFRQLLSVAFGLKPAPAWASVVSAELARILTSFGVSIAGVYIDDLLLRASSKELLQEAIDTCHRVCAALGVPLNDKTVGPRAP